MKAALLTVGILVLTGLALLIGYLLGSGNTPPAPEPDNPPAVSTDNGPGAADGTHSADGATATHETPTSAHSATTSRTPRPTTTQRPTPRPRPTRPKPSIPRPTPPTEEQLAAMRAEASMLRGTFEGSEWEIGGKRIRLDPGNTLTIDGKPRG